MKNFGILGCGMIANFHAQAIASIGAKLVACYDKFPLSAERLAAANPGCKAYNNIGDFLSDSSVDVVTVGTPSGAHFEPALAAIEAGKHVIVEKPLEVTLEKCDQLIAAADKAGVKLGTVFHSRFHDSSKQLKHAVETGRFGRLTLGDAVVKWYRTQQYYDSGAWRGTWSLDGGGALMNQAVHSVDLLIWLMGDVAEVSAQTACLAHERIEVEDTAVASLKFVNGALGTIVGTTAAFPGYLKRIEIHGSSGSAVLEEEDIVKWDFEHPLAADDTVRKTMAQRKSGGGGASDPAAIDFSGHAKLFANMLNAVDGKERLAVDGREGRKAVEVILATYEAAKTGKTVKIHHSR